MASTLEAWLPILADLSRDRTRRRSLADLAADAGRSPSHAQRAFSRVVGESPKQYTRRLQLECAAVMLLSEPQSVLDVALAVGFDSHEGFTRAFRGHFGASPRAWRARAIAAGMADDVRHADLLTHVGPCVGLFRAALRDTTTGEPSAMNYDITIQNADELTVLYQEARCGHAEIGETLGRILPAVYHYATTSAIQLVGPPMTLYMKWGPGMVTMRAGIAVAPGSRGAGDIHVLTLPAGRVATTIHTGPYDGLGDAHAAVETYLHEQGLEAGTPLREIYLTDPGEVPDPAQWKTQIAWPLAS